MKNDYLIDYSQVSMYFLVEEQLSLVLLGGILDHLNEVDPDQEETRYQHLEYLNNNRKYMTDYAFSYSVYQYIFKEAYKNNADLTNYIFYLLLDHEIRFLTDISGNKKNIFTQSLSQFPADQIYSHKEYSSSVKKLIEFQKNELDRLPEDTFFKFARYASLNTDNVQIIRELFKRYHDFFPVIKEDYSDKAATIRTLMNYGGTHNSAKELIKKYLM